MKATELRIGNWVLDEYADGSRYKTKVGIEQIEYPHNCQPIPLTEDILLKCGFEWVKEAFGYFDKLHAAYIWDNGDVEIHPFCTNDKDCWVKIKYLHQLQNLYFALTGEELNVEL
jgi:hypothetical protein